jgi:peptidyl-prolyl cis-trans isomerase SurA
MRRLLPSLTVLFFMLLFTSVQAEVIDRIVAVVNNDVVTQSELDAEAQGAYTRIDATLPPEQRQEVRQQVRGEVLDSLIDKLLVAQRAKVLKIKVTEKEIDDAVQQVLDRNKVSKKELLASLAESGVNENIYRNTLRSQLLQNKLIAQELHNKVVITDEMARKEYQRRGGGGATADGEAKKSGGKQIFYTLQQIGCRWDDIEGKELSSEVLAENKKRARQRIEKVYQMAKSGGDFVNLATQYSDLPSATDHGNLGAMPADELDADMLAAIKKLHDGEISDIIEMPNAFQFFKLVLTERKDRNAVKDDAAARSADGFAQAKDQIMNELYNTEMKKAFSDWAKELRNDAYIRKM